MLLDILSDAHTSGGLLISLPQDQASALVGDLKAGGVHDAEIIGRATTAGKGMIEIL